MALNTLIKNEQYNFKQFDLGHFHINLFPYFWISIVGNKIFHYVTWSTLKSIESSLFLLLLLLLLLLLFIIHEYKLPSKRPSVCKEKSASSAWDSSKRNSFFESAQNIFFSLSTLPSESMSCFIVIIKIIARKRSSTYYIYCILYNK